MSHTIGFAKRALRKASEELGRVITFEATKVFVQRGLAWDGSPVEGYEARFVSSEEFHANLPNDISETDYRWAFERGDSCMANLYRGEVVGWEFATNHATPVRRGLAFAVPPEFRYSFGAFTHPAHRRKGLADARAIQWAIEDESYASTSVCYAWYINVFNWESLAAYEDESNENIDLVGYAGYVKVGSHFRCFASPGCRRLGVGFMSVANDRWPGYKS